MFHDIEREPVSFLLRDVCREKRSGHLFVNTRDYQITLNFLDGKLANGMSTRFEEKLAVILRQMGRLGEEPYDLIAGQPQLSDDQAAGVLLDRGLVKKQDLYYARVFQLRRIAISAFALRRGTWIFTAGEPEPPLREVFEIPLEAILVEGARSVDHVAPYADLWSSARPRLLNEIPMDSEIYFTDAEREFYAAARDLGPLPCRELIPRLQLAPLEFWRVLLAFHLLGLAEFEPGAEEKKEEAPGVSAEIAAMLDLYQKLQAAPFGDPTPLALPQPLDPGAVRRASLAFLERFAPERFGAHAAPEIKRIAGDVRRCLQALLNWPQPAPEMPGEAEWRQADLAGTPGPDAFAPAPEPEEEEFELSAEFAVADEPEARPESAWAAPPAVEPEPLGEIVLDSPLAVEEPAAAEALAVEEIVFEAIEEPLAEAAAEPAAAGAGEVEWIVEPDLAGETPPPFAPVAAPPALHMADPDHEKAWDLLLQAKEFYEKRNFAAAAPLLKKAIRLEPKQGDFYYLLGLCQSESEITKNDAEINLKKAIELKSWSADPVYALGVLYRGQDKMKLAERCFQRVKEIAYEHTGASRALVDLRRRKVGRVPAPPRKKRS